MSTEDALTKRKACDCAYYLANKERIKLATRTYAKSQKGMEVQREAQARYRKTPASAEAKLAYKRTEKGKLAEKRSDRSKAGKLRHQRYLQTEPGKTSRRTNVKRSRFKLLYGITFQEYDQLVERQNGRCKICSKLVAKLVVDHDHVTGAVRGLLCITCNVGVGMLRDSIETLESAIVYLRGSKINCGVPV